MKKILLIVVLSIICSATYVAAGIIQDKEYSWRYKMTVLIETPEGVKTGTAVREMNIKFEPRPGYTPEPYHASFKMRGEAVAIDLGDHGVVFALINPDSYSEVTQTFSGPPPLTIKGAEHYSRLNNASAQLNKNSYPSIVTFLTLSDPKSVVLLKGKAFDKQKQEIVSIDRFEEILGKGIRLKDISVEMTNEKIEWKIEKFIPWIGLLKNSYLSGKHINGNQLYEQLYGRNFSTGE